MLLQNTRQLPEQQKLVTHYRAFFSLYDYEIFNPLLALFSPPSYKQPLVPWNGVRLFHTVSHRGEQVLMHPLYFGVLIWAR